MSRSGSTHLVVVVVVELQLESLNGEFFSVGCATFGRKQLEWKEESGGISIPSKG